MRVSLYISMQQCGPRVVQKRHSSTTKALGRRRGRRKKRYEGVHNKSIDCTAAAATPN